VAAYDYLEGISMKRAIYLIVGLTLISATFSGCGESSNNTNSRPANANSTNTNTNATRNTANANQTSAGSTDLAKVLANASATAEERVKAIDAYVSETEAKLPNLTRKERDVTPADLKGITEAKVAKVHTYTDGTDVRRIKLYFEGSQKTEEYYFHNDKLVYVFVEPQGAGKQGHDPAAKGDKLYFANDGLIAWHGEDGKAKDAASSEFKKMGEKLLAESAGVRKLS
jgi:hypothetical protein